MPAKRNKKDASNKNKSGSVDGRTIRNQVKSPDFADVDLRKILVTAGHAYAIWVPGDRNPYISDSLATFLGYFPESISTAGIGELVRYVHKSDRRSILEGLHEITANGGEIELDFRICCADRRYRWFRIHGTSYEHDTQGAPTKLIGCISDINELKQAQFEAERQQQKAEWLKQVSTQLSASRAPEKINLALTSLAGKLACSRTYLRVINPVRGEFEIVAESHPEGTRSLQEIVDEKYPQLMQNSIANLVPNQEIVQFDLNSDLSDAQRNLGIDLGVDHFAIVPLFQNGQLQGELGLLSDKESQWTADDLQLAKEFSQLVSLVFEREAIADGLRESEERFHLAMEASQDGLWDVWIGREQVYVSPSYFRMTGHDLPGGIYPREITGKYVHPDDLFRVRESLASFLQSDKGNDSIEFRMRHKNGSDVWVLSRMYKAELKADGSPSRVIGVNTDITEFKRIQNYLETAQTDADAANRAKSEFLARMSHEIRTPMNAILGLSHLVLDSELQPEQRNYIQHIDDAAQLLLNVINDILDFSKIEAGKLELDETDFNLGKVVSQLASLLVYAAEEKSIRLLIDLAPDVPTLVRGDATRLQQILVNLLNNAIKFTNHGGVTLRISMDADGRFIFSVKDSGIGIDEESQKLLFTPFSQADGSVTRRYGGTGLGLAICKYLVEMMGGDISFKSSKGVGSEFTVALPFSIRQPCDNIPAKMNEKQIVIVSDNPVFSRAADNLFTRWADDIRRVDNLPDFIAGLTTEKPCLCLVDDETIAETELTRLVSELENRFPMTQLDMVYLSKSSLIQRRSQCLLAPVRICSKPLTPESIERLLLLPHSSSSEDALFIQPELWQHCKILLVEDNPVNQKVALGLLNKYNLEVDVVADGQQAIDALAQQPADYYKLVLMDMEMPTMDGYAATRQLRQDARFDALPIVAMTAHAMKGDRDRCLDAGMNDYLSKPINPDLLYETLRKYIH